METQTKYHVASAVRKARESARMTQADLATKMGTTQSVVARLESGEASPSGSTLDRVAVATGSKLIIDFKKFRQTIEIDQVEYDDNDNDDDDDDDDEKE